MNSSLNLILMTTLYAIFNVGGAAIIKTRLLEQKVNGLREFVTFVFDPYVVSALASIAISMFFAIKALSLSVFSSVIPLMTGINFVLTIVLGVMLFKEQLTSYAYLGVFLIFGGIVLVGRGHIAE